MKDKESENKNDKSPYCGVLSRRFCLMEKGDQSVTNLPTISALNRQGGRRNRVDSQEPEAVFALQEQETLIGYGLTIALFDTHGAVVLFGLTQVGRQSGRSHGAHARLPQLGGDFLIGDASQLRTQGFKQAGGKHGQGFGRGRRGHVGRQLPELEAAFGRRGGVSDRFQPDGHLAMQAVLDDRRA